MLSRGTAGTDPGFGPGRPKHTGAQSSNSACARAVKNEAHNVLGVGESCLGLYIHTQPNWAKSLVAMETGPQESAKVNSLEIQGT